MLTHLVNDGVIFKMTLSKKRDKNGDLLNVYCRPVLIKERVLFSTTYHYKTKDEVKNFFKQDIVISIISLLTTVFRELHIMTISQDISIFINKREDVAVVRNNIKEERCINLSHNATKNYYINPVNPWWKDLGITTADGKICSSMQHKFKQICQYIDIMNGILKDISTNNGKRMTIADMGAGKGYLTFALYEYLTIIKHIDVQLYGIEIRKKIVDDVNTIINKHKLDGIHFIQSSIEQYHSPVDMVVALHACDTATDDAIIKGIINKSSFIVCAPCCHKQIRKEIELSGIKNSITRYGIFLEKQAVMITDVIRALVMEYYGYQTKVIEFIETEHTPKNVMLIGILKNKISSQKKIDILENIKNLKQQYGIKHHYIEKIFDYK